MTTKKKKNDGKKTGITRPRPDGGVKTQGECPNMENVTRHVVLNFRVSVHA